MVGGEVEAVVAVVAEVAAEVYLQAECPLPQAGTRLQSHCCFPREEQSLLIGYEPGGLCSQHWTSITQGFKRNG